MKAVAIIFFLSCFSFLGCCTAFPSGSLDNNSKSLASILTLPEEPTDLRNKRQDDSVPVAYAFLLSKFDGSKGDFDGTLVEKRDIKEQDQEDLETAAGTYVLRPLFVYRQQLAYRQRLRDTYRRENRF